MTRETYGQIACNPPEWAQEAYIKASNNDAGDGFGYSVSLDVDTLAVGANLEDSNETTITNGTTPGSSDNSSADSGAVYVFKRTGNSWAQEAYIKAANSGAGDDFGYTVSLNGDTLVVGAYEEDSNQNTITNGTTATTDNSTGGSGAAYVYKRTGASCAQEAFIKASNAGGGDWFGWSISINGDTLAVGASDEDSSQNFITNGTTSSADDSAGFAGAVFVYKRTGVSWVQEAYIKASNSGSSDSFGYTISLDLDTLAVGTPSEDSNQTTITNGSSASTDNSNPSSGAVYVYKRVWK